MATMKTSDGPHVQKICQQCHLWFDCLRRFAHRQVFCSRRCHAESRLVKVHPACQQCGRSFETVPSVVEKGWGRFCSMECKFAFRSMPDNMNGFLARGYRKKASRFEHRIIAERVVGRSLPATVVIHHVNGQPADNRHSNLVICENSAYHSLLHVRARIVKRGGDPQRQKICSGCQELKVKAEFWRAKRTWDGFQQMCRNCDRRRDRQDKHIAEQAV